MADDFVRNLPKPSGFTQTSPFPAQLIREDLVDRNDVALAEDNLEPNTPADECALDKDIVTYFLFLPQINRHRRPLRVALGEQQ